FIGGRGRGPAASPQEEVEDFISDRANYFPRLEAAADATRSNMSSDVGPSVETLVRHLDRRHRIHVRRVAASETGGGSERRSSDGRQFLLADDVARTSASFRLGVR